MTTAHEPVVTGNQVTITIAGDHRRIVSNGLPDHEPGRFPNRGNPNTISAQRYIFRLPLHPVALKTPTTMRGVFGVALNGVPFDPGTAEWWSPGGRGRTHDPSSGWNYDAPGNLCRASLGSSDGRSPDVLRRCARPVEISEDLAIELLHAISFLRRQLTQLLVACTL